MKRNESKDRKERNEPKQYWQHIIYYMVIIQSCILYITHNIVHPKYQHTHTHTHTYDNIPYICRLIAVYDTIQYLTYYIYINFNYLTIASMDFFLVTFNLFSLAKCELFRQDYKYLIFLIIIVQRTLAYDGNNNNNNGNNNCVK